MLHSRLLPSDNHPFYKWEFSNSAARGAMTTLASTDCGKVAWEISTNTFWILTSASPITWVALGTAPAAASSGSTGNSIVARDSSGNFSANVITATLTGSVSGNATTASRLFTARTVALTGAVTGTATFDGSANLTIATTAAPTQVSVIGTINTTGNGITASTTGTVATISSNATANSIVNTIVSRDSTGSFAANAITATTFTGALTGNAATSSKLFTPRTIQITGAVTGTAIFDGSSNLTITTTSNTTAGIAEIGVSGVGLSTSVVGGVTYISSNATASNTANTIASRDALGSLVVTSIRLPHGAAPTTPVDGDLWTTTSGLYGRINGVTTAFITDFESRNYGVPCDNITEASVIIQNAVDAISAAGGGVLNMRGSDPAARFYINGSVWARDKVTINWFNEILLGPNGRLGVGGKADDGIATYLMRADCLTDTDTIYLSSGSNYTNFAVGDVLEIRGENDITGVAIDRQTVSVVGIDSVNNTLTISPVLETDFLTAYPSSQYPNDKTTIKKLVQTPLLSTAEGTITVGVADATKFTLDDVVVIEDTKVCSDIAIGSTSRNQVHLETNIICGIDTATNTITLALPLAHTYDPAFSPKMIRTLPAKHAGHINPRIYYSAQSVSNNQHAMLFLYAAFCNVTGLRVMGMPGATQASSLGNRGHGCRLSDGSIGNVVFDTIIHRPAFYAAGQGYGVTLYNGARANTYKKVQLNGCRHSVLFFKGASDNYVEDVTSIDVRISDIDFHGANEVRNTVVGVKIIGGVSASPDSTIKVGVKFGNTSHRVGPRNNTVRNVDLTYSKDYAAQFLPSSGNRVEHIFGNSGKGISWKHNVNDLTLPMSDNWVTNASFIGGNAHIEVDGGSGKIISQCGARNVSVTDAVMNSSSSIVSNATSFTLDNCSSVNAANNSASYLIQANNVSDFRCIRFRGDGANRFLSLTDCPGAIVDRPQLTNQADRVVVYDGGGNTGAKLISWDTSYNAAFVTSGAGSTGFLYSPQQTKTKLATATSMPLSITGTGGQIVAGTVVPAQTSGVSLITTTFKPAIPNGLISVELSIPYAWIDTTNTTVAAIYAKSGADAYSCIGVSTSRLTGGASAGGPLSMKTLYRHALQDLSQEVTFEVRYGSNSATSTLTLGDRFGGSLTTPTLTVSDIVETF